jgi:hypothetical protein
MNLQFLSAFFQSAKKVLSQIGHGDETEVPILIHQFLQCGSFNA